MLIACVSVKICRGCDGYGDDDGGVVCMDLDYDYGVDGDDGGGFWG
jgi:hypothetical protein